MAKHFLVAEGLLTAVQLQRVRAEISEGETLNQTLLRLRLVSEADLARAASRHLGIPLISAADLVNVPAELISRLPAEVAIANRAVPVRMMGETILVAMGDPGNEVAVSQVRDAVACDIQRSSALESLIDDALTTYFGYSTSGNEFDREPKTLKMDRKAIAEAVASGRERRDTEEEKAVMRGTRPTDEQLRPPMPIEGAPTLRMPSLNRDTEETPQINPRADTADPRETAKWPPPPPEDLDGKPTGLYTTVRPRNKAITDATTPSSRPPSATLDDWRITSETRDAPSQPLEDSRRTLPIPTIALEKARARRDTTEEPKPIPLLASSTSLEAELEAALVKMEDCKALDQVVEVALSFMGLLCEQRAILNIDDGDLCGQAAAGGTLSSVGFASFRIPMERSSVFGAVVQSQIPYQGPLLFGTEERVFASHIGRHPEQILLVPITADDEVIGLLYGDGMTANLPLLLVRELASAIGRATSRLR